MAAASGRELLKQDSGCGTSLWAFQPRLYLYWILRLEYALESPYARVYYSYLAKKVPRYLGNSSCTRCVT
jgi:hypothetical protein